MGMLSWCIGLPPKAVPTSRLLSCGGDHRAHSDCIPGYIIAYKYNKRLLMSRGARKTVFAISDQVLH